MGTVAPGERAYGLGASVRDHGPVADTLAATGPNSMTSISRLRPSTVGASGDFMPFIPKLWDLTGGALLMRSGRAGSLSTVGRSSGLPRTIQCGYLRRPDGTILVGSAEGRQWPRNLEAAGWCLFSAKDLPGRRYDARALEGEERAAAIDEFRAVRGERAAAIFSGMVFELRRTK